jgi:hypothetical protein
MKKRIRPVTSDLCVAFLVLSFARTVAAQDEIPLPTRIEFSEQDLRSLLPRDGQLIAQGRISKDYVGIAFGREVRAQGKRVYVSGRKIGARGVIFKDGVIELNIGAHGEKEQRVAAVLTPTFAVDLGATAQLTIDDQLNAHVRINWRYIQGDNLGGKLVVEFAKGRLKETVEREVQKFAAGLGRKLREKLPKDIKVHVQIEPGKLVVIR